MQNRELHDLGDHWIRKPPVIERQYINGYQVQLFENIELEVYFHMKSK